MGALGRDGGSSFEIVVFLPGICVGNLRLYQQLSGFTGAAMTRAVLDKIVLVAAGLEFSPEVSFRQTRGCALLQGDPTVTGPRALAFAAVPGR